ncbi:hypothetical protein HDU93_009945 [Gonapodya sp. JEL0774]|nr:hypothetical protein HDU93_009945 [Gonapodya sp. JEL0774]
MAVSVPETRCVEKFIDPMASFFEDLHPHLLTTPDPEDALSGSWYLHPARHIKEFFAFNAVFVPAFLYFNGRAWESPQLVREVEAKLPTMKRIPVLDEVVFGLSAASFGIITVHKCYRGSLIYLVQPCHMSCLLIMYLIWSDPKQRKTHTYFNLYVTIMWGAWLALVNPDLRNQTMFLEPEVFWLEHVLVAVVPLLLAINKRFILYPFTFDFVMASFLLFALYHSVVLSGMAVLTSYNLNYLMHPPIGPLQYFGQNFRPVMYTFCCVLTFAFRGIFVEGVCRAGTFLVETIKTFLETDKKLDPKYD